MIRYQEFIFPAKYKNITKDELFLEFMNENLFLMATPALYSHKMLEVLKTVIFEKDTNETTWWKMWLKTESILAEIGSLIFLEYTIEKILENTDCYTGKELSHLILDFNYILVDMKNFSIFSSVEPSLHIFRDDSIPTGMLVFYKNRNVVSKILKENIPDEAIDKKVVKMVLGNYLFTNMDRIDTISIMREFLYREAIQFGTLNEDCVKEVCQRIVTPKYRKEHPMLSKNIWDEIKKIYDKKDK